MGFDFKAGHADLSQIKLTLAITTSVSEWRALMHALPTNQPLCVALREQISNLIQSKNIMAQSKQVKE